MLAKRHPAKARSRTMQFARDYSLNARVALQAMAEDFGLLAARISISGRPAFCLRVFPDPHGR